MTVVTVPQIEFILSPFPEPGEPVWDDICLEWELTDSDGIRYWGDTPSACYRQFAEALHYLALAVHKSGFNVAELRAFRSQDRDRADQFMAERPY